MSERRSRRVALDLHGLTGRVDLFRLRGAMIRDPAVESWFLKEPVDLHSMARHWFDKMRRCGDDVRELMHDGCPVACIEDAPFGYVNAFKAHVNVGFFNGATLEDLGHLLEGTGKRMRHVKLRLQVPLDEGALNALIESAYADIRLRLEAERPVAGR